MEDLYGLELDLFELDLATACCVRSNAEIARAWCSMRARGSVISSPRAGKKYRRRAMAMPISEDVSSRRGWCHTS